MGFIVVATHCLDGKMSNRVIDWDEVARKVKHYSEPVDGMGKPAIVDASGVDDAADLQKCFVDVQRELESRGFLSEDHKYISSHATRTELYEMLNADRVAPASIDQLNGLPFFEEPDFPDGEVLCFNPEFLLMNGQLVNPRGVGMIINVPYYEG